MNVWCHLPTIFKRRQALRTAGLITLCVAITTTLFFIMPARAATGVNQTLSFQGRLQSPSGAIVPDGYYNIQFKLYQDGDGTAAGNTEGSPAGSLKWTENHVNNNANQGIRVKNGYFSVTLGSVTPFGSSVDWNQDTLWLSMNIAGTAANCTDFTSCSPDGEMLPMKRLTAVPYAIQAQNATTVGGMNASELIHNQNTAQQTASNFWISGTGRADTALQAPAVDTATAGTLTIGAVNATDITIGNAETVTTILGELEAETINVTDALQMNGMVRLDASGNATLNELTVGDTAIFEQNVTIQGDLQATSLDATTATTLSVGSTAATAISLGTTSGNILTTVNGRALVKSTAGNNSTTAFQVQNASSSALLTADTTNMQVVIGNGSDTITLSSSGISFAGNARGTKQIRLAAEYENTVLDSGTGSNNSGTMVSTLDLTNRMNFYRWSATPASAQTYDIVTQVPIPQDFSAWAASNPLSITSRTNHTTDGAITLELRDSSGTERCSFTSLTMGSANSWITNTPSCLSSGTYTPGDYLTMRLRMSSKNNAQVDVGNIVLNYLSNK